MRFSHIHLFARIDEPADFGRETGKGTDMIFTFRTPLRSLALVALLAFASAPALADVKAGVDAWGRGDYDAAVAEWRGPAASGDADAQFNLAQAYKLGRGVPQDLGRAEQLYKRAADQGHLQASDNYGLVLFQNNRRSDALPYLTASAERGEPRAQYVLGTGLFNGDFVAKDWTRAYALMTRASAQGLPQATASLAQMDKYIPLDDRRRAISAASEMETNERRVRSAQVAGLSTPALARPATPGPVARAQLPASAAVPPPLTAPPAGPVTESTTPGVTYLPPSPARPIARAPDVARPTPAPIAPAPAVAPVGAAEGDWRVQLGAFSSQGSAKSLWNRLEGRVSGLSGLQPYLVNAGKITRLQAGPFASKDAAGAMCAKVKAAGNDCIVRAK